MRLTSSWWPRVLLAVGAAGLIGALVSISVGERGPGTVTVVGIDTIQRTFGGIPQDGARLGPPDAEIRLDIFNDLQCPPCADWHFDVVVPLVEELARPGDAALNFRHFSTGPQSTVVAAYAATAAGDQGRQWQYAHMFFMNQDEAEEGVTVELLQMIANAIPNFRYEEWDELVDAPETLATVRADAELTTEMRLPAEPAVIVHGPEDSVELRTSPTLEEIRAAIDAVS